MGTEFQETGSVKAAIDAVERLQRAGVEKAELKTITVGGATVPFALLPNTQPVSLIGDVIQEQERLRLEAARPPLPPGQVKGTARVETLESFCDLVNHHKTPATRIFALGGQTPSLLAIVDYHGNQAPNHCVHGVAYVFPKTESFKEWSAGHKLGKQAFARWLNDRRLDLAYPDQIDVPAEGTLVHRVMRAVAPDIDDGEKRLSRAFADAQKILALIESLQAKMSGSYTESRTDRWGNTSIEIKKEDKVEGHTDIPGYFLLSLAVFPGASELILPVRLNVEVIDGGLALSCTLIGVDKVIEAQFAEALTKVEAATGIKPFRGSPEK